MSKIFVNNVRRYRVITSLPLAHKNIEDMRCKELKFQTKVYDQIYFYLKAIAIVRYSNYYKFHSRSVLLK